MDLFDKILPRTKYVGEIGLDGGKDFSDSYLSNSKLSDIYYQASTSQVERSCLFIVGIVRKLY